MLGFLRKIFLAHWPYVFGSSLVWMCRILNFECLFWFFPLRLSVENNNKYLILKIQHVQIDVLPRTLEKIVAYLIMFYHMYIWWNEISPYPTFPLSSPMAVECSVAQFWQSRPSHPSIRNWEILPRFRVRELSNGWGTLYHWVDTLIYCSWRKTFNSSIFIRIDMNRLYKHTVTLVIWAFPFCTSLSPDRVTRYLQIGKQVKKLVCRFNAA